MGRRLGPHLITIVGTLVLPFLIGWLDHAARLQRAKAFAEPWALELAMTLLVILASLMLLAPTWWSKLSLRAVRVDWPILLCYLLPGVAMVSLRLLPGIYNAFPVLAEAAGYWTTRLLGGILIGTGLVRSLTAVVRG